ncbi:hypothetical protein [Paracoccus shanxieyensis]|uniref:Uncharacterized protein n=1 Tax=Paracoccus shanxieyensis TaxID=2675752 RepID=A0A6L6IXS0_9RHOB|nr:hypothetical protein [Paracoccus shanxieyensis]MTH64408.1 hypothetical protein [Paracoccus shanxieyensis]MTH87599.1 hypothetical protein [Paracoccus shanxieyensis]
MGRSAAFFSAAALVLLLGAASFAEDAPERVPMPQFVVKPIPSPSPSRPRLDRSAEGYARCAGYYLYATKLADGNKSSMEAEAVLMAKALVVGGPSKAEALQRLRDDESVQVEQRRREQAAAMRRIDDMDEQEQASLSVEQQEDMMRPMYAELLRQSDCNQLVWELREKAVNP